MLLFIKGIKKCIILSKFFNNKYNYLIKTGFCFKDGKKNFKVDNSGENEILWKKNCFKTGDVERKKSCFEDNKLQRKSSVGGKTPLGIGRGLEDIVASPSSLARSPAMHEGFRYKQFHTHSDHFIFSVF